MPGRFLAVLAVCGLAGFAPSVRAQTAPATSQAPKDIIKELEDKGCALDGLSTRQLDGYGHFFARQMLGDHNAPKPDMEPLNAAVSVCARQYDQSLHQKLIDRVVNRLAWRWAERKFSTSTGLPHGIVSAFYNQASPAVRADIGDQGIGDTAADAAEAVFSDLLGRDLTDDDVDLIALALKLQAKGLLERGENFAGNVAFDLHSRPQCIKEDLPGSTAAACAARWHWDSRQRELASSFAAFDSESNRQFKAVLTASQSDADMTCDYMDLLSQTTLNRIELAFPLRLRAILRRTGMTSDEAVQKTAKAVSAGCHPKLGAWAARPENRIAWTALLKALARRDQAQVDFDLASGME